MTFGELKSIAHNAADSLASGIGLMIGFYEMDVFGEAAASPEGYIVVDFLTGQTSGGRPSAALAQGIAFYHEALADLCARHGTDPSAFSVLTARYGVDRVYGRHFEVTVADLHNRRSVDHYIGVPGKRARLR